MAYILIVLLLLGLFFYWFHTTAKKNLQRQLIAAENMVKLGLSERLLRRYTGMYEREFSFSLAAAVTNEVFSEVPRDHVAKEFLQKNKELVEQELRQIGKDDHLCHVITQTIRASSVRLYAQRKANWETVMDPIEKLERLGIWRPGGQAPALETVLPLVRQFYESRNE